MRIIYLFISIICMSNVYAQQRAQNSFLEVVDVITGARTLIREFDKVIEAPNWTKNGKYLIYNSEGKLYKIAPKAGARPVEINTGFANQCNNDHVLSPDDKQIAISHQTAEDGRSRIYTLPMEGGNPCLVTALGDSYLHGWSPDYQYLCYCANRNGNYDVYKIPAKGGVEIKLTSTEGLDDGPEYAPNGKHIWFNSVRTGLMQVWRMNDDGSEQIQMTMDETRNSWFPHISPNGKLVLFIAYAKGDVNAGDHPADKDVELRLMSTDGGESRVLVSFFGGQGSLNVNSWAPDSHRAAFVSYRK